MRLVKPAGTKRKPVRPDALEQLRDVGARLEYVLSRYARLVSEMDAETTISELTTRVDLVNSQLVYVTRRLQELLLLEREEPGSGEASFGKVAVG